MKGIYIIIFCVCGVLIASCHTDYLDLKSDQGLVVPGTLKDLEALMDNTTLFNANSLLILGEIGTDDYYLKETDWNLLTSPYQKNGYVWAKDIYEGQQCPGWNNAYQKILYSNIVLEGINRIERNTQNEVQWNRIKGTALFWRAWQFFQLAQMFCDDYEKETAVQKLGIPIRLNSNINQHNVRASIDDTYKKVVSDLSEAALLLPSTPPQEKTRPSKQAVHAVFARAYLQMKEYGLSKEQADKCLTINSDLIDYNILNYNVNYPFPQYGRGNSEQLLFESMIVIQALITFLRFDSDLLSSYDPFDLRPSVYFSENNGYHIFKGTYNGYRSYNPFPALDEVYLIRAECNERLGHSGLALEDLNTLLVNRYKKDHYVYKSIGNTPDVLRTILDERRKSLVVRGVRWSDLRRLRKEPAFAKPLIRKLGNRTYELKAEQENLYTWPIPDNVVTLGQIPQNNRQ